MISTTESKKIVCKSLWLSGLFFLFLGVFFTVVECILPWLQLKKSLSIIFIGDILIVLIITGFHFWVANDEKYLKDHLNQSHADVFIRGFAGVLEIFLFTAAFALKIPEMVVGYLVLKAVSVWRAEKAEDQKMEGLSTAILRVGLIFAIIVSLIASNYISKEAKCYLNSNDLSCNVLNLR